MLMATLHELARAFGHFTSFQIHYRVNLVITTTSVILGFSLVHIHTRTVIPISSHFCGGAGCSNPSPRTQTRIFIYKQKIKNVRIFSSLVTLRGNLCVVLKFSIFCFFSNFFRSGFLGVLGQLQTVIALLIVYFLFFLFFDYSISVNNFLAMVQGLGM